MGSSPVQLDFSKAQPIAAAPAQSAPPVSLDFSQAQPLSGGNSNPYPIADDERGALNQTVKTGTSLLKLPGSIWQALTQPPADEDEKAAYNLPARRLPSQLQLAIYRLVQKPMEREHEIAKAYQTIAESKKQQRTTPQDDSVTGKVKRVLIGDDDPDIANAVDMAQVHHIASVVPLLGPLAADISEHFHQGDEGGALASLLSNIAAGKALDSATKVVGKQIAKVAPKTASVAGEPVTIMAGQEKNAAPIAEEIARIPSTKIAAEQQAAAQQGIKNIATDAANKSLSKFNKSADEVGSFSEASERVREQAQKVFKVLDSKSDGLYSTYQNKMAAATKVMRRATNMEDLESAEAQFDEAQKAVDKLISQHADEIGPQDLANAKSAWRDQAVLKKIDSYVQSAFSAPEDVADASNSVTRTLRGNTLRPRLTQMLKKLNPDDVERVLGRDSVKSLYEIASITSKPEGLSEMQNLIGQIAGHGYITRIVKSPIEARNLVARYLSTSPRVAHTAISALKFGTPAKIYAPIIANAIAQGEQDTPHTEE